MQEESGIRHNDGEHPSSVDKTKTPKILDYTTWLKRGWCALELFAMAMKTGTAAKACSSKSIIRVIKFIGNTIRNLHAKRGSIYGVLFFPSSSSPPIFWPLT